MTLSRQIISWTTDTGGNATVYGATAVLGFFLAALYAPGTTDTGATVTLTSEGIGSKPLMTKATAGTSNAWFYPRDLEHKVEDDAALTGTAGADRTPPLCDGRFKVVIASGGDTKTGQLVVYYNQ